ncbi:MAG: Rieske (2Fe-2S) protein [Isosphaeraceae bacterium]
MADDSKNFTTVARVGEIPEGEGRAFEIVDKMVAVFLVDGTYRAIDDCCPHQGAPLCDGFVDDCAVTCSWHGWRFSLEDGRHLEGTRARVEVYSVRVQGDEIQVAID